MSRHLANRSLAVPVIALLALAACKKAGEPAAGSGADASAPAAASSSSQSAGQRARQKLAAPVAVKEVEPNDDWKRAQTIAARAAVSGELNPRKGKTDDDWFKVAVPAGQKLALQIDLAGVGGAELDATLEVLDRDRNRLARVKSSSGEALALRWVSCVELCFVHVAGRAGAYTLTVAGEPPLEDWELEPNDRAVDATPLLAGASIQGFYGAPADQDWYRLAVPEPRPGQFLRIEISGVAGVRPELEVRSLDGALLTTLRGPGEGQPLFVRNLALAPPPPAATTPAAPPPAATTPAATAPASPASAASPAPTAPPAAAAASAADADAGSSPSSAPPSPADLGASQAGVAAMGDKRDAGPSDQAVAPGAVAPSAGQAQAQQGSAPPSPAVAPAAVAPAAGAPPAQVSSIGYFLVVRSGSIAAGGGRFKRGFSVKEAYTLSTAIETGPADLEVEPNDDPQHATDLGPSLSRSGYLAPAGDVDWYRVRVEKPSVLHVELSALERADVELSVYGPAAKPGGPPQLLAKANEGAVREGEVLPAVGLPAGDSFIKVESAARNVDGRWTRDTEDRTGLYKLVAQLSPDDGTSEREPNDAAHAQPVTLPVSLKGTIWPRKDVDVFQFHIEEGHAPVTFKVSAVRGVDLMLVLRQVGPGGKGGETIGTADAVKGEGEEQIVAVPLKPGDYQIEVSSPRHKDASATQGYTLTVQ